MSSVEIGKRVPKTEENPYGYEKVVAIPKDEVCVVCLGGDGATTDKAANGYAKIIQNEILESLNNDVSVYSITYNFGQHRKELARKITDIKYRTEVLRSKADIDKTLSKATEEEHNPKYIEELFERVILPRITLHNGKGILSVEEACKRIRKLNIVAHCHGAYVALKLEEKMQATMKELGYNEEAREAIQSQMLIVAQAPACPLRVSKSQFISFRSVYDSDIPLKNNIFDRYVELRKAEERRRFYAERQKDGEGIENNRWFDFKPCFFSGKQGNLFMIKQKYEWDKDEGPYLVNSNEHNYVGFSDRTQTNEGRLLAHFAKTILRNGIKNSLQQGTEYIPLPPIDELILSEDVSMHPKEVKNFEEMKKNGKNFRNEACQIALRYHQSKQAGG